MLNKVTGRPITVPPSAWPNPAQAGRAYLNDSEVNELNRQACTGRQEHSAWEVHDSMLGQDRSRDGSKPLRAARLRLGRIVTVIQVSCASSAAAIPVDKRPCYRSLYDSAEAAGDLKYTCQQRTSSSKKDPVSARRIQNSPRHKPRRRRVYRLIS